jgi:hypothetical protein
MPTTLSSLPNRGVVPGDAIFNAFHLVSQRTLETVFDRIAGLTAYWDALPYEQGEIWPSLNENAAFVASFRESAHGGVDPTLRFRVDFQGDSEARQPRQPALMKGEQQARACIFEALIDAP